MLQYATPVQRVFELIIDTIVFWAVFLPECQTNFLILWSGLLRTEMPGGNRVALLQKKRYVSGFLLAHLAFPPRQNGDLSGEFYAQKTSPMPFIALKDPQLSSEDC